MNISVAICTWNRSQLLDGTLKSLCALRVPPDVAWEVLVVNNRCTDDTDAVLAKYQDQLPLRRLFEPTAGHSHARNCAVAAANGDVIVWTDDDVQVQHDWLEGYARVFRDFPTAQFFAGPVEPWFEVEPPTWFRRHLESLSGVVVCVDHGGELRTLRRGDGLFGANMAVRTRVAREFPFNVRLGRVAASLTGGDDTEFINRLFEAGYEGMWVPGARLRHFVPKARIQSGYVERWFRDAGRIHVRQTPVDGARIAGVPRWLVKQYLKESGKAWLWRPTRNDRWFRAYRQSLLLRGMIEEARG